LVVGPEEFRGAGRLFASGVSIVTVAKGDSYHGMTVTALAFVSLQPPLLLVCLEENARTRALVEQQGRFAVNVLSVEQEPVAKAFALAGEKSLEGVPHHLDESGAPMLDEAVASISCRTTQIVKTGDHDTFIAEVLEVVTRGGDPLVYFDRSYHRFG
jgi:flavin reductase (DIM6/NTAB) family NADH-FMN oxidoreductase RutF